MRIVTKQFGFIAHRWLLAYPPRWYHLVVRIGCGEVDEETQMRGHPYRYWAGVDIQLFPNFIWWQDLLGIEHGVMKVHTRIVGIQSWPFMRFCGGRP